MKKLPYIVLAIAALAPVAAGAYTMHSSSVSSSNSGGVTANSGEVITTGASDAYSEVHTTITSGNSGGTSTVYIKTNTDGVVHEQTTTKIIPPGGSVTVEANSSAHSPAKYIGSTTGSSASSTPYVFRGLRARLFGGFSRFLQSIFGWFGR